jgi:hypothetical protein
MAEPGSDELMSPEASAKIAAMREDAQRRLEEEERRTAAAAQADNEPGQDFPEPDVPSADEEHEEHEPVGATAGA